MWNGPTLVAPGANIALVLTADNSFTNLDIGQPFTLSRTCWATRSPTALGFRRSPWLTSFPSELVVENSTSGAGGCTGYHRIILDR